MTPRRPLKRRILSPQAARIDNTERGMHQAVRVYRPGFFTVMKYSLTKLMDGEKTLLLLFQRMEITNGEMPSLPSAPA